MLSGRRWGAARAPASCRQLPAACNGISLRGVSAAAFLVFGGAAAAVQPDGSEAQLDAARLADSDSFTSGRDTESERATTSSPTPTPTPTPVATVEEDIVTESVAFEETTIDDADLPKGQTQVTTPGRAGERTLTYRVTVVDGVETERELVSDVVTTEPVTQVTAVGTYVEPPPPLAPEPEPAQPSGCDPNYANECVPVSSDVDCAGEAGTVRRISTGSRTWSAQTSTSSTETATVSPANPTEPASVRRPSPDHGAAASRRRGRDPLPRGFVDRCQRGARRSRIRSFSSATSWRSCST
ncbi:G5 domain-containing protein [Microbacterium sp. Marseille-Q6648]|uniref:G5 domain-containing protein n=1 Tax=Microbacterium sp. Marseille-Q6648 TaxID=2937991 RepID=UPI0033387ABB